MSATKKWESAVRNFSDVDNPQELAALAEVLIEEFKGPVYATALSLSRGDKDLAADIFQDTFVRIMMSRGNIRSPAAFPKFLKVVTINVARDIFRRKATERKIVESYMKDMEYLNREELLFERRLYVKAYLNRLNQNEAEVLKSYYFLGEDDRKAGERLGKSKENIRVIRHRALARLRKLIDEEEF